MLKLRLVASSFAPMAIIVAVRLSLTYPLVALLIGALGVLAVLSLLELVLARSMTNQQPFTLTSIRDESAQIPAFLLTYVFPFVFVAIGDWRDALAYGLFALLLLILIVRTDLVLVNPLLLAFGFHLYIVESSSGYHGILLSSKAPKVGETVQAVRLPSGGLKQMAEFKENQ
jgi:hypothetical protein